MGVVSMWRCYQLVDGLVSLWRCCQLADGCGQYVEVLLADGLAQKDTWLLICIFDRCIRV